MEFEYLVDGTVRKVGVELRENGMTVREGDAVFEIETQPVSDNEVLLFAGGRRHRAYIAREGDRTFVRLDGRAYVLAEPGEEGSRTAGGEVSASGGGRRVTAPMPGKVIKVCVAAGDAVRKNQTLVIVEAMKMENEIKAAAEGVVVNVTVAAGELVDAERTLVELEPAGAKKETT